MVSDQLTPEYRGTERHDREDQDSDVLAALACGSQLGCCGQSCEFVDTSADSCKYHTADENIHGMSRGTNYHAHNNGGSSNQCDPSATDQIGNGSSERADGCKRQQIGQDEPDPAVSATCVALEL